MSVTMIAKAMWTPLPDTLPAKTKGGKDFSVSAPAAKSTLIAIADSADDFGENSYNSIATLSLKTSLEERSIPRILRALEQNHYCINKGVSRYGTSNYSLNVKKLGSPPQKRPKTGRPKSTDSQRESTDSPRESTDSQRESTDSPSPDPSFNHPNPSFNQHREGTKNFGPDWQIGHDEPVVEPTEEERLEHLAFDKANLIATGKPSLFPYALEFIRATEIFPTNAQVKEWRKQMTEWLKYEPRQPRPEHVKIAVDEMKSKKLTIARPASLFNLQEIAGRREEPSNEPSPERLEELRAYAKKEFTE